MRDWSKIAVGEGAGGTVVVADVFAAVRVVLNDDKGGGGVVGGGGEGRLARGGGLVREGNGKGFIDLDVIEIGEGVEEVLVVWLWDCELPTKFISPILSLKFLFPRFFFFFFSFFGPLLIEGQGQLEGVEGRGGQQGWRKVKKGYFRHTALF